MGFEALGVTPPRINRQKDKLIIVGSARCVWEDLDKILTHNEYYLVGPYDVMAVNDMIMHFPGPLEHAYSNDNEMLPWWVRARRPRLVKEFGHPRQHSCNANWELPGHGTSGLNAVYCGIGMGYDRIILAGIPLTDEGHYFEPPWRGTNFTKQVRETPKGPRYWEWAAKHVFDGKVASLSGRTRELLGERYG